MTSLGEMQQPTQQIHNGLQAGLIAQPDGHETSGEPVLTQHRPSLSALTGIRFFAAAYVVLFHTRVSQFAGEHGLPRVQNFFQNGYLAVPLFFILSGLILAYTYRGQIEHPHQIRRFWEARIARLWPAYVLSLLCASVPNLHFPSLGRAAAAIFMVQAWNPLDVKEAGDWNFVCWTLSAEAFFYLCFPWFQSRVERVAAKWQLVMLAALLTFCVAVNSSIHSLGTPLTPMTSHIPFPLYHLSEFLAGVCLGNLLLQRRQQGGQGWHMLRSGIWTYASGIASIALLARPQDRWTSLVVLAFSALLLGLAQERTWLSRFLSTPTMLLAGGISYSMYLFQLPIKDWTSTLAGVLHLNSVAARLCLTGACLIAVSLLVFRFVEEPSRKALRALFAGQRGSFAARRDA